MAETIFGMSRMHCGECGIEFAVPDHFYTDRKNSGKGWHCPNGHSRVFRESDADKLRRERDQLKQQMARVEQEREEQRARAEQAERREKRLKKRTAAGTCPCCQRTFSNMSTHMRKQHPQFVAEQTTNVVKLKA